MTDTKKIYIDIHSLLEIRQSTLIHLLGTERALDLVHTRGYYMRDVEEFEGVDMAAYQEAVKDPAIALKHATVTYLINVLINRLGYMDKLSSFKNEESPTELVVNIYPYNLPDKAVEMLRDAIFMKLGIPVLISIVNHSPEVWSPSFIKNSGVIYFYCYDPTVWMGLYGEQLSGGMLRDVQMFFPTVGKVRLDKGELKQVQKSGFKDIFSYTEFLLSPYTRAQFLPSVFYSNLILSTKILQDFNDELSRRPLGDEQESSGVDSQQPAKE